ncbi:MAG: RebB family R body protein [Rhizomicrobium sp.]
MADNTLVNGQITDAVTQANLTTLGSASAVAAGSMFQVSSQAFGLMMQNAVAAQQQLNIAAQAVTTQGVALLYAAGAASVSKIGQSDVPDNMLALLAALRAGTAPFPPA